MPFTRLRQEATTRWARCGCGTPPLNLFWRLLAIEEERGVPSGEALMAPSLSPHGRQGTSQSPCVRSGRSAQV